MSALCARLLGVLVIAGVLAACGASEDPAESSASGGVGSARRADWKTTLPDDFPPDIPIYPGAELSKVRSHFGVSGGLTAVFTTSDAPDKVASEYADFLAAEGWVTERTKMGEGEMIFADKEGRTMTVTTANRNGRTELELLLLQSP